MLSELEAGGLHPGCQLGAGFDKFWMLVQYLETPCTQYLVGLLNQLQLVTAKRSKTKMPPMIPLQSLLNTIQFVGLFFKFKNSKKITELVDSVLATPAVHQRGLQQALKPLKLAMSKSEEDHAALLKMLVNWISVQHAPDEFKKMTDFVGYPTLDPNSWRWGEYSFIFVFLKEAAEAKSENVEIIVEDTIFKRVAALPQVMKMNPKVAENSLMAYVHFLSSLTHLFGGLRTQQLCQTIHNFQQFYFWPNPLGNIVEKFLVKLEKEVMSPQYNLCELFQKESSCVRFKEFGAVTTTRPVVYHIMDTKCSEADIFVHVLNMQMDDGKQRNRNRLKTGDVGARNIALLLLNIINNDVPLSRDKITDFMKLSQDTVKEMYSEVMSLFENLYAAALGVPQKKQTTESKEEVAEPAEVEEEKEEENMINIMGSSSAKRDLPPLLTPQDAKRKRTEIYTTIVQSWKERAHQGDEDELIGALFSEDEKMEAFSEELIVIPDICHKAIKKPIIYTITSAEQRRLAREEGLHPPETEYYETLKGVIENNLAGANRENKLTFKVALSGGDEVMHAFLCALVRLKDANVHLSESVNFKFYVIPVVKDNRLACYIARHDSWYYRNIYAPFSSDIFVLPWIALHGNSMSPGGRGKKQKNQLHGDRLKKYYQGLLDNYMRHAEQTLNVKVWNAKVYETTPEWDLLGVDVKESKEKASLDAGFASPAIGAEPSQVIPFFQRLEIGFTAEFARYIESEGAAYGAGNNSESDLISSAAKSQQVDMKKIEERYLREKKYQPPEVKVRISRVGLDGKVSDVIHEHSYMSFHQFILSNVPSTSETRTFPPNPTDPWLEMYVRTSAGSTTQKSILNQESRHHICRMELSVKNEENRFSVLIDGVLFPPANSVVDKTPLGYQTIVIERLVDAKGNGFDLPIQTFYPIDVY